MKPNFHHSQQSMPNSNMNYQQTTTTTRTVTTNEMPTQRTTHIIHQQVQQPKVYSNTSNLTQLKQQAHAQMMMNMKPGNQQIMQQHQQLAQGQSRLQSAKHAEALKQLYGNQDRYVGYIPNKRELVDNSDIFNKKLVAVRFTALICKQLKADYNDAFNEYKKGITQVSGVDPNIVKQRATILVQQYFKTLREKVQKIKFESMQKIQSSESLRELERIIESSKTFTHDPAKGDDHFEREKRIFDEKIGKSRFAYLVKRQDFYQDLISSLESNRQKLRHTLEKSQEQMSKVVKMTNDEMAVRDQLSSLVGSCVDVDMKSFEPQSRPSQSYGSKPTDLMSSPQRFQSENGSMRAQQNSGQSMQRSSMAQFSSSGTMAQQPHSPSRQQSTEKQSDNGFFNVQQQRQAGSPGVQQSNFSPITRTNQQQVSSTPPRQASPGRGAQSPHTSQDQSPISRTVSKEQNEQEEVIVTSVVNPQNPLIRPEHQFKTTHKLKGQCLLKLVPGRGWAKMRETKDLFLSKCVQTLDDTAYIIGGSRDRQSQRTISDVIQYSVKSTGVISMENKAPLNYSRSSHGCVVNVHKNEIYVVGGYHDGALTRTCEAYDVKTNQWRQLPPLNEEKCSSTLCVLNGRYLYCFGGLTKQENAAYLLSSIEMLDLEAPQPKWIMLSIKMPHQVCDMGAIPLSENEMLLFGGWNKQALTAAFVMRQTFRGDQPIHSFAQVNGACLDKPDFFMISGVAMRTNEPNLIKVCGHTSLFVFDLQTMGFKGSSSM